MLKLAPEGGHDTFNNNPYRNFAYFDILEL